jgi:REP element-mobilizing transposase RayT
MYKTYLYAHVIWAIRNKETRLGKTIRVVLFAHLQKTAEEKGIKIIQVGGADDHVHVLVQLHPAQNLAQVIRQLKAESSDWLNATQLLPQGFEWEEEYAAYSVSPSAVKQVMDYLDRQEEYHKTKSLEAELEVFEKVQNG